MWEEVKFWAIRYWKWILGALGMLLLTLVFILVSRFSASDDSQMKKIVKEEEKIEQTVQKQEEEIKGKSDFPDEVENLPTEQEILVHLYGKSEELGTEIGVYTEEAFKEIEEEFGLGVRLLVEEGYTVSREMTAEQRNIIQMIQMSYLWDNGLLESDKENQEELNEEEVEDLEKPFGDLNTYVWYKEGSIELPLGIPKPKYHVKKYLSSNIEVTDYEYGIGVVDSEQGDQFTYTLLDLNKDSAENGYDIPNKVELKDVIIKGGMVAKMDSESNKGVLVYLIMQPKHTMKSDEFLEIYDNLEVEYSGKKIEEKISTSDFLGGIPYMYNTQLIDVAYVYTEEDGYTGEEPVELKVNGESISLILEGKEFTSKVK